MVALDRWALARARELHAQVVEAYRDFQFHLIYQKVHNFCVVDLGALYLDVLKDRLYTTPARSAARRSAQTAMYHIAESMVRWLAPILSFTADEIWRHLPGERTPSVFFETWHDVPDPGDTGIDWVALIALRTDVMRELEKLRDAQAIGAPLDAAVSVSCTPEWFERLSALGDELRFLFITSEARVQRASTPPAGSVPATAAGPAGIWISVGATDAPKCVRCWHRRADVGSAAAHPELCARCVVNVTTSAGETRRFA
jgi:isoleucyl-tRNA synthetase